MKESVSIIFGIFCLLLQMKVTLLLISSLNHILELHTRDGQHMENQVLSMHIHKDLMKVMVGC